MAKIHTLKIKNFQGIEQFEQQFESDFICIIGRGDSGKSTILKAISNVLYPNWNLVFYDTDFYNCNIDNEIEIEATLYDIPEKLLQDSKFGRYIRGIDSDGNIQNEINDELEPCLTIKLVVNKDLEPKWYVVSDRQDDIEIRAGDRSLFNVFLVSDYIEKHFSWNKGNPLYSLLRENKEELESEGVILESIRGAKDKIDDEAFSQFDNVLEKVKLSAKKLGLDVLNLSTTIDFRDISIKESKVSLHDDKIPFRQKGKGTKRLLSMAIQHELIKKGGIILIDEIEQGLEPDRVQHLVSQLKKDNKGQIFITTHSRDVLVELEYKDLFLKKSNEGKLNIFNSSLQGCIRRSPEAFFSKRVIVCEGATEIGICRALNDFRISKGKENMSFLGIKIIDGTGSGLEDYCNGLVGLGYKVCLFCDSDVQSINEKKQSFRDKNIEIVDWDDMDSLEMGIFNNINFEVANELFSLVLDLEELIVGGDRGKIEENFRKSLSSLLTDEYPTILTEKNFTGDIQKALSEKSGKNKWFKNIYKGEQLGKVLLSHYDSLDRGNIIKENFDKLTNWIEND